MWGEADYQHMRAALNIAGRGLGRVAPNPSVGCVLVQAGRVIARARTGDGGHPHAEETALEKAGEAARGATVYVTLEPCSARPAHTSCCDHLISAGVERVVAACGDLNPAIDGRGLARLRQAGIDVDTGLMADDAAALHAGFFNKHLKGRPLVALKCATSQDGQLATASGESQWITGQQARRHGHMLRARHDAVLTGIGTVRADDPRLTCRIAGMQHAGTRIVLDTKAQLPIDSRLFQACATNPLWCVVDPQQAPADKLARLRDAGVSVIEHDPHDINGVLGKLAEGGLTRILVEAGPSVLSAFVKAGLYDRIYWYQAPGIIGDDGQGIFTGLNIRHIQDIRGHICDSAQRLAPDLLSKLTPVEETAGHV